MVSIMNTIQRGVSSDLSHELLERQFPEICLKMQVPEPFSGSPEARSLAVTCTNTKFPDNDVGGMCNVLQKFLKGGISFNCYGEGKV